MAIKPKMAKLPDNPSIAIIKKHLQLWVYYQISYYFVILNSKYGCRLCLCLGQKQGWRTLSLRTRRYFKPERSQTHNQIRYLVCCFWLLTFYFYRSRRTNLYLWIFTPWKARNRGALINKPNKIYLNPYFKRLKNIASYLRRLSHHVLIWKRRSLRMGRNATQEIGVKSRQTRANLPTLK